MIIVPAVMNKSDLNRAWVDRCRNVSSGKFSPRVIIITPNCLSVDNAMIFFMSFSVMANIPASVMVAAPTISAEELNSLDFTNG